MNFRTRIKNLNNEELIKKVERLSELSLDCYDNYFREFMYAIAQMNKRGINHDYSYKGVRVQ